MDRTMSAMLRRSLARSHEVRFGSRIARRPSPSHLVAVSILQFILFGGLALLIATGGPGTAAAHGFGGLALLSAAYIGWIAIGGLNASQPALSPQAAPTDTYARDPSRRDSEHLDQLRQHVSHELRTPLNAMIGFSDMMQKEMLGPLGNERYREYAAHIRQSAEQFQQATERTLAITELLTRHTAEPAPHPDRQFG